MSVSKKRGLAKTSYGWEYLDDVRAIEFNLFLEAWGGDSLFDENVISIVICLNSLRQNSDEVNWYEICVFNS